MIKCMQVQSKKILSWFNFLGKNLHLVLCSDGCASLLSILPKSGWAIALSGNFLYLSFSWKSLILSQLTKKNHDCILVMMNTNRYLIFQTWTFCVMILKIWGRKKSNTTAKSTTWPVNEIHYSMKNSNLRPNNKIVLTWRRKRNNLKNKSTKRIKVTMISNKKYFLTFPAYF